jgi:hypothetical protein
MIFTDAKFFAFFPLTFAVYWWLGDNRSRKQWLLICSVIFYAAWDWRFLGVVLAVILNTYFVTRLVGEWAPERWRGRILTAGIAISLSVLGFFKYYNFFADSLARVTPVSIGMREIVLPIGISFYTFHSISYMIDSYQRKIAPAGSSSTSRSTSFSSRSWSPAPSSARRIAAATPQSRSIASVNFNPADAVSHRLLQEGRRLRQPVAGDRSVFRAPAASAPAMPRSPSSSTPSDLL